MNEIHCKKCNAPMDIEMDGLEEHESYYFYCDECGHNHIAVWSDYENNDDVLIESDKNQTDHRPASITESWMESLGYSSKSEVRFV